LAAQELCAKAVGLRCSYLEVYNEEVFDLLSAGLRKVELRDRPDARRPQQEKEKKEKKRKPRVSKGGGGKVFVGGLASKTTEETLVKVFSQYGQIAQANVLLDPASRRSRGFGYVTFVGEVPEGVIDRDHLIDGRLCGARLYKY